MKISKDKFYVDIIYSIKNHNIMSFGSLIKSDPAVVNTDSNNWSGGLSSNVIPRSAYSLSGGMRKNNNNTHRVYMTKTKGRRSKNPYKRVRFNLATIRNKRRLRTNSKGSRRRMTKKRMRGGQYGSNQAVSTTYSTGAYPGVNYSSAMTTPPPILHLKNQAYDNYNHNIKSWFNSR
jgi:hypothetical protein